MPDQTRVFFRTSLLVVLATLVLCLAILEAALRVMGNVPLNFGEGIFEQRGKSYGMRANLNKQIRNASFSFTIRTNDSGFRDRVSGPHPLGSAPYFAILGDSATFGNGVDYDDSFVGVFARSAATRGIDVINLAIGGHNFSDQKKVLQDFLGATTHKPVHVGIVFTNHFIEFYDLGREGLLVKDGNLYSQDNWLVPHMLNSLKEASTAYGFFAENIRKIQGRASVVRIDSASKFLETFSRESRWALPAAVARFEAQLTDVDKLIRNVGAEPVYVFLPVSHDFLADEFLAVAGRNAADYDFLRFVRLLQLHADRSGIKFVDLTVELAPALQRLQTAGKPISFLRDPHYTAEVNHIIGHILVGSLLGEGDTSIRP